MVKRRSMDKKEARSIASVIKKMDEHGHVEGRRLLWLKLVRGGWLIEPPWHVEYKYKVLGIEKYAKKYGRSALPDEALKKLKKVV